MENLVKLPAKEVEAKFTNLPEHLEGIEPGDILVVSKFPAGRRYSAMQRAVKGVRFRAVPEIMNCFQGVTHGKCGEILSYNLPGSTAEKIIRENGYEADLTDFKADLFFDMLVPENPRVAVKEKEVFTTHSIREKARDKSVIDEMIGKVDFERMKKLCNISVKNNKLVTDEGLRKILEAWADAKYEFYLAFGRKLSLSREVKFKMDPMEISESVYDMYKKYPKYAATIDLVVKNGDMEAFVENSMPNIDFFKQYVKGYSAGMKVSGFFSRLFDDEKFNIDFSKVLQDREVKGKIVVSIDPYDYLTSAINMHGWSTCHKLFEAPLKSWTFLTDDTSVIAFRENGRTYTYDEIRYNEHGGNQPTSTYKFGKNSFEGNSKSWRQFVFIDKDTCSILTGREYPKMKDLPGVADTVRDIIETAIAHHLGIENSWSNYGDLKDISRRNYFGHVMYHDVKSYHYSDMANWTGLAQEYKLSKALVSPDGTDMSKVNFNVGGEIYCVSCGGKIKNAQSMCCCG